MVQQWWMAKLGFEGVKAKANTKERDRQAKAAVVWFRKAAEQGNAFAQLNLGIAYQKGEGVPQDYAEASAWFRKAAEQGDAFAQVKKRSAGDYPGPLAWFRRAAEHGDAAARKLLSESGNL